MDDETIHPETINKLQRAGIICSDALKYLSDHIQPGSSVDDVCKIGDDYIQAQVDKLYKKVLQKGPAYPTTISVNSDVTHKSTGTFKEGDLVKVYVATHIEGWTAHLCQSFVLREGGLKDYSLPVIQAAFAVGEIAAHIIKPDVDVYTLTQMMEYTARQYGCRFNRMITSHESLQWLLKGEQFFPGESFKFELGQLYNIDIVVSEGPQDTQIVEPPDNTVYFRNDKKYRLKTSAGRKVIDVIEKKYFMLPFDVSQFSEPTERFGVKDCIKNELIEPCEVYRDRTTRTARYSFSIIIGDGGIIKTTGIKKQSTLPNDDFLKTVLNHPLKTLEPINIPENFIKGIHSKLVIIE